MIRTTISSSENEHLGVQAVFRSVPHLCSGPWNERKDICAYSFVYVDAVTDTALIEPVSTRERYRHKGLGTAMLNAAVIRCRNIGIGKCNVNSFGGRKDFIRRCGIHSGGYCILLV